MNKKIISISLFILIIVSISIFFIFYRSITTPCCNEWDLYNKEINQKLNQEITKNPEINIIVYPIERKIRAGYQDNGWFGFYIKNNLGKQQNFSYNINVTNISCPEQIRINEAEDFINFGEKGRDIELQTKERIKDPIHVMFSIPKNIPLCNLTYSINVYDEENNLYASTPIELEIIK
jgi:c-di-AMP phosphodiesterase-like protein